MLVLLVVVGGGYLLYCVVVGVLRVANAGRRAAYDGLRHANRELRDQIIREFPVLNFDPADGDACAPDDGDAAAARHRAVGGDID